jgi:hypothetical protein
MVRSLLLNLSRLALPGSDLLFAITLEWSPILLMRFPAREGFLVICPSWVIGVPTLCFRLIMIKKWLFL